MEEILSQADTVIQTISKPSALWYQALTLTERLSILEQARTSRGQAENEKAAQYLHWWKNQLPFRRSKQLFEQRLKMDELTEENLLTLLAQPAEELQSACSGIPGWLEEFFQAFTQPDPAILATLPLEQVGDPATNAAFMALKPLLTRGFARMQAGITEIQGRYTTLPFDPRTVGFLLLPQFLDLFLNKPAKMLVLEVNVARVKEELQGETPEQRFLTFLQQLSQPEKILTLYEEYPVLARQLVEMIERWVSCSLELLQRLCADWEEIREFWDLKDDPGQLIEIKTGAGDIHQRGHSVTILSWSSGLRLVYKPRSLAIDAHFQELLTWLNAHGWHPAFRISRLLSKQTYGWYEFFPTAGCTTKEEVERFYERMGGYLALFYVLEATDFHAENLLAVGEHPLFIDLESLFQPYMERYEGPDAYGYELLTHSVRRCGLLPQYEWFPGEAAAIDLSSLGGQNPQTSSLSANSWTGRGTDEMSASKIPVEIKLSTHRPTFCGAEVNTLEYEQNIIAGFTAVYRLILQHRDEFAKNMLPRFMNDEIRILVRSTQVYASIQSDSFHPDMLRNALDRERLFHRLWQDTEQKPYLARVIAAERTDLENGDIPKFVTHPDSRDLFTSQGECLAGFFPVSGLDLVKKGLENMGENDLERQIWLIRASFASMEMNRGRAIPRRSLQLNIAQSRVDGTRLITEARTIADRLRELALVRGSIAGWAVLYPLDGREWRPSPAGLDLYNGLPGIILFFAYLGLVSDQQDYTDLAGSTTKMIQTHFLPIWPWRGLGAFDGLGSLLYLFSHLGTLWHDPTLYVEARKIVSHIPALVELDRTFDLLAGSAGAISALLSLHAVDPDETTLATALQCGDHLLKHARRMPSGGIAWSAQPDKVPLAGLSHGNAGIALSLLRLAAVSGEDRFHQAALDAMAYERSIFSPEKQNWPDLRDATSLPDSPNAPDLKYMIAWCHGAPGIGMARLASLQYHDDAAIRTEIDAAVQTTFKEGFGRNHSLCHGDMGNIETLLLATQLLPQYYSRDAVDALQTALLESMQDQGWQSGIPYPLETPGLMLGLAGTGYALLRLADPARVPSLLTLTPPPARA